MDGNQSIEEIVIDLLQFPPLTRIHLCAFFCSHAILGWESRRRRTEGHDFCLIKLGIPGRIVGVDIDTSYFNGNHPHAIKLEGVNVESSTVRMSVLYVLHISHSRFLFCVALRCVAL
jgi:hypothetical protein